MPKIGACSVADASVWGMDLDTAPWGTAVVCSGITRCRICVSAVNVGYGGADLRGSPLSVADAQDGGTGLQHHRAEGGWDC